MGYIIGIAWTVSRRLEHGGNGYLTSNKCASTNNQCVYIGIIHTWYIYIWIFMPQMAILKGINHDWSPGWGIPYLKTNPIFVGLLAVRPVKLCKPCSSVMDRFACSAWSTMQRREVRALSQSRRHVACVEDAQKEAPCHSHITCFISRSTCLGNI